MTICDHRRGTSIDTVESHDVARLVADALEDKKADDIALLDVASLVQITDVFVIATGSSNRHVKALADAVDDHLIATLGRRPIRTEGITEAEWVLLDFGEVVVHVFQKETREFYDLERLWGDAPRLAWEPESKVS
ncbi:MAG: ribosome silencing factor [Acidimicrobiia bacterium]|nr:ribosome silencing factor [Acidimicrobiia bacterium]